MLFYVVLHCHRHNTFARLIVRASNETRAVSEAMTHFTEDWKLRKVERIDDIEDVLEV